MNFFDTVIGTVNTAVDTISSAAHTMVEKNRVNAKLNRLRTIMKNESELMNRAYIALGKQYYENKKKGTEISNEREEKLFELIEASKAKIAKARDCYRKTVDSQNDIFYGTSAESGEYDSTDVVDITVACSNENEYDSSPFDKEQQPCDENQEEKPLDEEASQSTAAEQTDEDEEPDGELF